MAAHVSGAPAASVVHSRGVPRRTPILRRQKSANCGTDWRGVEQGSTTFNGPFRWGVATARSRVTRRAREKEVAQRANAAVPRQGGVLRKRNEGGREEPARGWWWVSDEASDPLPPGQPQVTHPLPTSTPSVAGAISRTGTAKGGVRATRASTETSGARPGR